MLSRSLALSLAPPDPVAGLPAAPVHEVTLPLTFPAKIARETPFRFTGPKLTADVGGSRFPLRLIVTFRSETQFWTPIFPL